MHTTSRLLWAFLPLFACGCDPQARSTSTARGNVAEGALAEESTIGESVESLISRGAFEAARGVLAPRAAAESHPGHATLTLALVETLGFGRFDPTIDELSGHWESHRDEDADAEVVRTLILLLSLEGRCGDAWQLFLEAGAEAHWPALTQAQVLDLLIIGSGGLSFEGEREASAALLALDPDNAIGLSVAHRLAIADGRFQAAQECWRRIHLVDYLADELWTENREAVSELLEAAVETVPDWFALAIAYSGEGYYDEAAHCAEQVQPDARSAALVEALAHARRFLAFRSLFVAAWRDGLRSGFESRGPQRALIEAQGQFASTLLPGRTVETDLQIFEALRKDYGYAFYPDWGHPIMAAGALVHIVDERAVRRTYGGVETQFERVLTGRPLLDVSRVWNPLLGAEKAGVFVPWWPDAVLLGLASMVATVQAEWWDLQGASSAVTTAAPWDLDPEAAPLVVVSGFRLGNQGRACFARRRELALQMAKAKTPDGPLELAFKRVHLEAQLAAFETHEVQHLSDRREGLSEAPEWSRALSEFRAFLATLRHGPALAQYEVLARVATGGDKTTSSDPYEIANYDLLEEVIRTLHLHPEIAPTIDRKRNLQAQLHLLDPQEIRQVADVTWERRFGRE